MREGKQVLVIASAASFLVYLDVTVVNIAFPDIEAEFSETSRGTLAWILAAYNITFAALLVPGGRISDRFGRRRLFGIGIVVFALASAGCGAAGSAEMLIAFRVLQAIGGAMLVPASQGLVLDAFPQEQRTKAISLWVAAGAVAVALGPPLGGLLVDLASWHWVFFINLPIAAAVLLAARGRLRESRDESTRGLPDPVGIALSATAVGALVLAIVQGDEWGWTSPETLGAFAAFAVLTPLFVLRTRRALVPALDLGLFSSRAFSLANVASLTMGIAFYGLIFASVLFMTTVWAYSPIEAGLALAPAPLVAAVSAGLGGRTAEGASLIRRASAGIVLFAAGTGWLLATLDAEPDYVAAMLPGTILVGAGAGLAVSLLSSAALQAIPPATFAAGGAVNSATRQVGAALGVATIVAVVGTPSAADAVGAFEGGWLALGLAALASLPFTLAIGADALTAGDQAK